MDEFNLGFIPDMHHGVDAFTTETEMLLCIIKTVRSSQITVAQLKRTLALEFGQQQ